MTMTDRIPGEPVEDEGTPRWVKVFFTLAIIVVVVFVVALVVGGGHRPGRHGL
jgi:ABC-type transporter Mla subunit MlaD